MKRNIQVGLVMFLAIVSFFVYSCAKDAKPGSDSVNGNVIKSKSKKLISIVVTDTVLEEENECVDSSFKALKTSK
jgi:hypothetical protein